MAFPFPQSLDFLSGAASMLPAEPALDECPYYFSLHDGKALQPILLRPPRFFLEAGTRSALEAALRYMYSEEPDFALNITTASAFDTTLSEALAVAIEQRFFMCRTQRMNIMTCLQEAIANALLHGNLSLPRLTDPAKFQQYHDEAAVRLGQDKYGHRRISIAAWHKNACLKLTISDEGNGFPTGGIPDYAPSSQNLSGRGLFLIRSLANDVWVGPDNRTLCMTFKHIVSP